MSMKPVKGDVSHDGSQGVPPADAANEPVMDGSGPPAAWDPFEVWRTRVRDVQQERSKAPTPPKAED
ncbi:MAG: hypothetical protein H6R27_1362 [Proteobacteria bacterium]|nr:hypothetical protein [Pseudomonadota bacterium]